MFLFLDRLPLYSWLDSSRTHPVRRWSVSLPARATVPGSPTPRWDTMPPQRWVLDTAFTGDAYAWRSHLEEAGLNPRTSLAGTAPARSAFGQEEELAIRGADLWLFSNIPALQEIPFLVSLSPGIVFRDAPAPDPEFNRPLIGTRALLRAGVTVQIDFAKATVSLWTPGPWYRNLSGLLRRLLPGYATVPIHW